MFVEVYAALVPSEQVEAKQKLDFVILQDSEAGGVELSPDLQTSHVDLAQDFCLANPLSDSSEPRVHDSSQTASLGTGVGDESALRSAVYEGLQRNSVYLDVDVQHEDRSEGLREMFLREEVVVLHLLLANLPHHEGLRSRRQRIPQGLIQLPHPRDLGLKTTNKHTRQTEREEESETDIARETEHEQTELNRREEEEEREKEEKEFFPLTLHAEGETESGRLIKVRRIIDTDEDERTGKEKSPSLDSRRLHERNLQRHS